MKILIVSGIFPPDHGGPATYVPRIASALMERGHEVVGVVTLADKLTQTHTVFPFPVFRIPRQIPRVFRFAWTVQLIFARGRQADVVYLNGLVLEGILATKLLRRGRAVVKVVGDLVWEKAQNKGITTNDLDTFQAQRQPILWQLLKRLQGWYTAKADAVVTPSEYLASVVRRWGVLPERINVVYNAVDVQVAEWDTVEKSKLYDLVTVARIVPWKGLHELVTVAASNGWSLRIVGDGPLIDDIKRLVTKMNAMGTISFAGQVAKDMVAAEIRSARVFVLNSRYEGLPHIVLEAKAAGVPVVATAAGGTPETIAHGINGYLVPVGDDEVLADRLRFLLSNPQERKRLVSEGFGQMASQFSLARMFALTESVLLLATEGREVGSIDV
jgi:glycosyltransferase involved in cell wall biosynthesis